MVHAMRLWPMPVASITPNGLTVCSFAETSLNGVTMEESRTTVFSAHLAGGILFLAALTVLGPSGSVDRAQAS
jgi:hypothetical protein